VGSNERGRVRVGMVRGAKREGGRGGGPGEVKEGGKGGGGRVREKRGG